MSGEIEAMGALATGGLVAHALGSHDDHAGEQLHNCQNCGATLAGPFCHACGQSGHVHRTLGHVAEEFAHGVFHVESKGWRTLPMLVINPGRLTREYIHGKRARYIAPIALFLFMIFLTFATFGLSSASIVNMGDAQDARIKATQDLRDAEREVATETKDPDTNAAERATLQAAVAAARAKLTGTQAAIAAKGVAARGKDRPITLAGRGWTEKLREANARGDIDVNTGYAPFDKRVHRALEDPEFAAYKIEEKASKLSFLLVPMSLPVLWLLFARRRGVNLYDHAVFVLYSLSFVSLLVIVGLLLLEIGMRSVAALMLVPPVHMFVQLKGAYSLSVGGALWRTAILSFASIVIFSLYLSLMLLIGLID